MAPKLCGFNSLRCILTILNGFYITVGLFLIGVVIAARTLSYFTYTPILAGIAVCGTLVVVVAILGLAGTIKHHQVVLFFYMVVLCLSFLTLFGVSVAALAAPSDFRNNVFLSTWRGLRLDQRQVIQDQLNCCGFDKSYRNYTYSETCPEGHPACNTTMLTDPTKCCFEGRNFYQSLGKDINCTLEFTCPHCDPCYTSWEHEVSSGVLLAGSFGLIFSFTMIIGIVLTCRYRNEKDPQANPSSFL